MKPIAPALRLLVFVGCFLLLLRSPSASPSQAGPGRTSPQTAGRPLNVECQTFEQVQYNCPSGCSNSKYTSDLEFGSGMDSQHDVPTPCGAAKKGQSCAQPFAFQALPDFNCCGLEGDICFDGGCCDGLECCPQDNECHTPEECF